MSLSSGKTLVALVSLEFSLVIGIGSAQTAAAVPTVDFQRQVRPILSDNCFRCHGPDKGTRMVDLRLDIKEGALATRKNGTLIIPGKPDESLLIKRVFSDDTNFRMPPAIAHKTLTQAQKETLRNWIQQGATWKEHWAFIAPVKPPVPEVKQANWARNDIDRFIEAKLEANGLEHAPEADKRSLIRRVTLDLTGLPPTPDEVAAFLKDQSPKAYEKVVGRLLESKHYGEHRARYWLDAARYADSQGLHIDNYREMWPYRDWVIQAFNDNMPFDEFTIEQLAGDLLDNATLSQKIASGFHRCNVTTNEGGSIPAEVEAMYAKDRADTTGTVWLGLTVGCATCHDHKFDPIRQREYYSLTSFFRNTTQLALDGNVPDTPPTVVVPRAEDWQRWTDLSAERAKLQEQIAERERVEGTGFTKWLGAHKRSYESKASYELEISEAAISKAKGVTIGAGLPGAEKALNFEKEAEFEAGSAALIDSDKPFTVAMWIYVPKDKNGSAIVKQSEASAKQPDGSTKTHGWRIELNGGELGVSGRAPEIRLEGDDGKYIRARPAADYELKPETWTHLAFSYDGSRSRKGLSLYINGAFVPTYGSGEDNAPLMSSVRTSVPIKFSGTPIAEFRIFDHRADEVEAKLLYLTNAVRSTEGKSPADLTDAERSALRQYYAYTTDPGSRAIVARLHAVDAERYAIAQRGAVTFVMQERTDTQPVAHVLYRGLYDQQRDEVHPTVPAVLPPMAEALPKNRLGLARWLVDPANPLTARVTVNRFWQELFGTGIVKTAEDFGSQGEPPSHPELLDWLALDFRESGWDVKRLFKEMVMSATYRQSAVATQEKIDKDPDNRLLARGPRFRMDGEMVRDYALAVSGLLNSDIGGPSVKPYQPINIWETVAMENSNTRFYKRDDGEKLYRRSLYTFWKRSAPPPSMDIFNAPSREVCIVRRERTNTPLQALVTMNDPQFVEAARALAQHALKQSHGAETPSVNFIANVLLGRSLETKEFTVVDRSYKDFLSYYDSKPEDAVKLLGAGASKADAALPKPEFAAMTMVANELMNLDEVLVK